MTGGHSGVLVPCVLFALVAGWAGIDGSGLSLLVFWAGIPCVGFILARRSVMTLSSLGISAVCAYAMVTAGSLSLRPLLALMSGVSGTRLLLVFALLPAGLLVFVAAFNLYLRKEWALGLSLAASVIMLGGVLLRIVERSGHADVATTVSAAFHFSSALFLTHTIRHPGGLAGGRSERTPEITRVR